MTDSYRDGVVRRPVAELRPGDRVDLEADEYADSPLYHGYSRTFSEHPEWQFEYEVVGRVELETPDCIAVHFESGFICGFPSEHEVEVDGEQVR